MLRVTGTGAGAHVENRMGEPCANPYLNIAAQLFAGLDGLVTGAAPDASASAAPGSDLVPQSLRESLDAFRDGRAADCSVSPWRPAWPSSRRAN